LPILRIMRVCEFGEDAPARTALRPMAYELLTRLA